LCDRGKNSHLAFTPLTVDNGRCICWWCGFLYEANSWEYSLYVPQDVAGLIQNCGGTEAFKKRLDTFFINRYYNVGNEPSFLSPVLYHWIGMPSYSSDRIRTIIEKHFTPSRNGLPGNDDSGAMSSWLAFQMLGLFPNAGQSYYLINSPMLAQSTLHLSNGKTFTIVAKNLSAQNKYIQSAKLNNKTFTKSWIEHSEIMEGAVLVLEMGNDISSWGTGEVPPSLRYQRNK
jgi:putative alpha-1,2-mannosidase